MERPRRGGALSLWQAVSVASGCSLYWNVVPYFKILPFGRQLFFTTVRWNAY